MVNIVPNDKDNLICPICRGGIPNNYQIGMFPGALSRFNNKTEICSACGTKEALACYEGEMPLDKEKLGWGDWKTLVQKFTEQGE